MTSRQAYLDSHPSINASMEDYEAREFSPTFPDLPSQHSGFRSAHNSEYSEASSRRSHSPPAWRKAGSGWFKQQQSLSPQRGWSKDPSPQYHSVDEEADARAWRAGSASRVPLPASPVKGRSPSNSPEPAANAGASEGDHGGGDDTLVNDRIHAEPEVEVPREETASESNYIRFTGSVAVQQKTDGIEAAVLYIRKAIHHVSKSRHNAILYTLGSLLLYWLLTTLFSTPTSGPVPDLIKVAGLAKSFEPVIYYSEAGHQQIGELQDTGVAVWDLGESVRNTNMTSAPIIVNQLESLSDSLKDLSTQMTSFFAGLDADVDAILLVMEWAGRELTAISEAPPSTISSVWSNAHTFLERIGVVKTDSRLLKDILGQTIQQRTRATLEKTFAEFLNVMEESINNELQYSMQLFGLFEAIDKQFLNLHRTVIREQDQQERIETDFLSSLWTKAIGVNASKLRKYEKNRNLLQSVRDRTVRNKSTLLSHNQNLLQMKSSLERLRQRLVSPLVRNGNSSTLGVEEQIRGLEGTYEQLRRVREEQKSKKMALMFGVRERRDGLQAGAGLREGRGEIEGRLR